MSLYLSASKRAAGLPVVRSVGVSRPYATGPSPAQQSRSTTYAIGGIALVSAAGFLLYLQRPNRDFDAKMKGREASKSNLDPAARIQAKGKTGSQIPDAPLREHPEDKDPSLQAAFGQQHARKRVDESPQNRNHQEISNRQKVE